MLNVFRDRTDAGRELADAVAQLALRDPIVLALPRGGVPVAVEVARRLGAPLDLLLVRKIGAPRQPELAVAAVAEGDPPALVLDEETVSLTGARRDWIEARAKEEQRENERRRQVYLRDRPRPALAGRDVVLVDDGIATGTTVRAALKALRARRPARLVLAVPVAAPETAADLQTLVDALVCLRQPPLFQSVGAHYRHFDQVSDEDVIDLLDRAPAPPPRTGTRSSSMRTLEVAIGAHRLPGELAMPESPRGVVVFAHGSGSSRHSSRNRMVAAALHRRGLATLLFDLLTADEADDRRKVFDIPLLSGRLGQAIDTLAQWPAVAARPVGVFGASTGAAAALVAAAERPDGVSAVVSRGGRPDLAGAALLRVRAPTLLIVGGADTEVLALNEQAATRLAAPSRLAVVAGATHLFAEPGALEQVAALAADWFAAHLARDRTPPRPGGAG